MQKQKRNLFGSLAKFLNVVTEFGSHYLQIWVLHNLPISALPGMSTLQVKYFWDSIHIQEVPIY